MTDQAITTGVGQAGGQPNKAGHTVFAVLLSISFCHLLNDMMQSLLPAIYPQLKVDFGLSFGQIGLVTLAYQMTASILQPIVGFVADKRPTPLALPGGNPVLAGGASSSSPSPTAIRCCSWAPACWGWARRCSTPSPRASPAWLPGGRFGLAQSLFQVGGNAGQALGPLAAALVVVRYGQSSLAFFAPPGPALLRDPVERRPVVQAPRPGAPGGRAEAGGPGRDPESQGGRRHRRATGPGVLQVLLPGQHHQLLHLLPDREVPPVGGVGPAAPLRLPRRGGGGDDRRRTDRGQVRAQIRDLVFGAGRAALHPAPAPRQPVLDRTPDGDHRPDPGLGLSPPSWCSARSWRPARSG